MHHIINRLFQKRGIKDINDLDEQERKTYEGWQAVLSKEELTTQDIKNFCQQQVELIETRWADYGIDQTKKAELIPYHTIYTTLLKVVDSPRIQREILEKNLSQLL